MQKFRAGNITVVYEYDGVVCTTMYFTLQSFLITLGLRGLNGDEFNSSSDSVKILIELEDSQACVFRQWYVIFCCTVLLDSLKNFSCA